MVVIASFVIFCQYFSTVFQKNVVVSRIIIKNSITVNVYMIRGLLLEAIDYQEDIYHVYLE